MIARTYPGLMPRVTRSQAGPSCSNIATPGNHLHARLTVHEVAIVKFPATRPRGRRGADFHLQLQFFSALGVHFHANAKLIEILYRESEIINVTALYLSEGKPT